jgi:hypothetical protein
MRQLRFVEVGDRELPLGNGRGSSLTVAHLGGRWQALTRLEELFFISFLAQMDGNSQAEQNTVRSILPTFLATMEHFSALS